MSPTLSPGYTQGDYVDEEANAELLEAMAAAGADFDTVEYSVHHAQSPANATGITPGRRVIIMPGRTWAHTPESCTRFDDNGEWMLYGLILVCPGCGMDCT